MQTGFITALQPFSPPPQQIAVRRADEPGQSPAERLRDGQPERDRANDRAARPGATGASRAGLVSGGVAVVAQESQESRAEKDANGLTEEERRVVAELKQRDAEVRAHEAAHKAAAGAYAGAVSYTYQQGPDGRRYAVGGEVPIDISTVPGDPQATVRKMQQIRRAALAPAEPSGADRAVAAAATKAMLEAQAQIASERAAELSGAIDADGAPQIGRADGDKSDSASVDTGVGAAEDRPREARFAPPRPDQPYAQPPAGNDQQNGVSLSIVA